MKAIVCVDDRMGMAFHGRRQSQDGALRRFLLEFVGDGPLWMPPYSARQFTESAGNIRACEDFAARAEAGEWCFFEQSAPRNMEAVLLLRWNRKYPGDVFFAIPDGWKIVKNGEFPGKSHEKITWEVYEP